MNRIAFQKLLLSIPLGLIVEANAATVADSASDFSGTQGENSWSYGYYTGALNPSSFSQLSFDGAAWLVDPANPSLYWTSIGADTEHPNGTVTSGGRTPVEQWVVRRWQSEVDGNVNLNGTFEDLSPLVGVGTGVTLHVFAGNNEVYTASIDEGGTQGFNLDLAVTTGLNIDFAIDPRGNDFSDTTRFVTQISTVNMPDGGSSLMLLSFSTLGLFLNRRAYRRLS